MSQPETPPPEELLSAYLDGEASGEDHAVVERHLAADPAASARLDAWGAIGEAIRDAESAEAPGALDAAILAGIDAVRPPARMPKRNWAVAASAALAATLLLAVGLAFLAPGDSAAVIATSEATPESEVVAFDESSALGDSMSKFAPAAAGEITMLDRSPAAGPITAPPAVPPGDPLVASSSSGGALVLDAEADLFVGALPAESPATASPSLIPSPPAVAAAPAFDLGPPLVIRVAAADPDAARIRLRALVADPFGTAVPVIAGDSDESAGVAGGEEVTDEEKSKAGDAEADALGFGVVTNSFAAPGFGFRAQTLGIAPPDGVTVFGVLDPEMLALIERAIDDDPSIATLRRDDARPAERRLTARARVADELEKPVDSERERREGETARAIAPRRFGSPARPRPVYFVIEPIASEDASAASRDSAADSDDAPNR